MNESLKPDFLPVIWPEAETPPEVSNCRECELHKHRTRIIWGEGNPYAPIIAILDNPGAREDKAGNPFVCGTRQTLQLAAFEAGFKIEDIFITYILKCRPINRYNKESARSACSIHLIKQIEQQKPKFALCMGNVAVQWFFGNTNAEVKDLRGRWYNVREIPTMVTYHPLAVRRRPNLLRQFTQDWKMLAMSFNGAYD